MNNLPQKATGQRWTQAQWNKYWREQKKSLRETNIAVLDFETTPFDNEKLAYVVPKFAVLWVGLNSPLNAYIYAEKFETFRGMVLAALDKLPGRWTIYAHNGGKFDWRFLIGDWEGPAMENGNALIKAEIKVGLHHRHEIRDSMRIYPFGLKSYKKLTFDYKLLASRANRKNRKVQWRTFRYCAADCKYTLEIVRKFVSRFGFKDTAPQAALSELVKCYPEIKRFTQGQDALCRPYYYGGRVECLAGGLRHAGPLYYLDVNSMYPFVMSRVEHPIGDTPTVWDIRDVVNKRHVDILWGLSPFVRVRCINHGALVALVDGELTSRVREGEFYTTKHEYDVAMEHGLLERVERLGGVAFIGNDYKGTGQFSNFSKFVEPLYAERFALKERMVERKEQGQPVSDLELEQQFIKLLLNSAYGKFAQNPENYQERYYTKLGHLPPRSTISEAHLKRFLGENYTLPSNHETMPPCAHLNHLIRYSWTDSIDYHEAGFEHSVWVRPVIRLKYWNVAIAASITGAARAVLLDAICRVKGPVYCDTDSLICESPGDLELDPNKLGAWKHEDTLTDVRIVGKKAYMGLSAKGEVKKAHKGFSDLAPFDYDAALAGDDVLKTARGVTLARDGKQQYIKRTFRLTAHGPNKALIERLGR
jgi:hypothetical protein